MENIFSDCPSPTFYRFIKDARLPERADKSAAGTLPTRATRYCEPITSASSFGWWVYSPLDFSLQWDDDEIFWKWKGSLDWEILEAVQFPDFEAKFDDAAPEALRGYSLPFITALRETGIVQVWTGLMATTAPGWSLLVRPLANFPNKGGYTLYEGIIETDIWFSPIFTNIKLNKTNKEIKISQEHPLVQIQPIPRIAYSDTTLGGKITVIDIDSFTAIDWDNYNNTIVKPNKNRTFGLGPYATAVRRRRRNICPFSGTGSAFYLPT